jgi:uncharacterized membrane protein
MTKKYEIACTFFSSIYVVIACWIHIWMNSQPNWQNSFWNAFLLITAAIVVYLGLVRRIFSKKN